MNRLPSGQQQYLLLHNNPHRGADFGAGHTFHPNQLRSAIAAPQVDLGLTVTEDENMGRLMIVGEDNHPPAVGAKYGDNYVPR
jgi:hypothetical protein